MRLHRLLIGGATAAAGLALCAPAMESGPAAAIPETLRALSPTPLPPPPPDVTNRYAESSQAARLGQRLFFDPGFSGPLLEGDNDGGPNALGKRGESGKVSCAGCHVAQAGFLDDRTRGKQVSLAAGWTVRRAPSLLDAAQSRLLHWDGAHDSFFSQVFGPLEHDNEMNSSRLYVAEQLFARYRADYELIFGPMPPLDDPTRFPPIDPAHAGCQKSFNPEPGERAPAMRESCHGLPGDQSEFDRLSRADQVAVTRVVVNFGKAVGAYLRLLTCGPSRFDRWVHGDAQALTASERRGALLFAGTARCIECHAGPYFSDERFHNVGLAPQPVAVVVDDLGDGGAAVGLAQLLQDPLNSKGRFSDGADGRLPAAVPLSAAGAFRTPRLRCVSMRPSFMHTGQLRSLEAVVDHFNRGGVPFGYPGRNELKPLGLSASDRMDLVAFLKSLQGPGPTPPLLQPMR